MAPAGGGLVQPGPGAQGQGWRFRRARIVSEPLANYIRFEYESARFNIAAGEEVRWLPRASAPGLLVPLCDYWVFDGRLVRFGLFAGGGRFTGHEMTAEPEAVRACAAAFEAVWERAVPHADCLAP
jgi:hypothetical protein